MLATKRAFQLAKRNMSTNFLVFFRHLNSSKIARFINYCYPTILLQALIIPRMFFLSTIIFKVSINLPQIWHNYLYTVFNNAMLHSSQETTYNKNYSDVV